MVASDNCAVRAICAVTGEAREAIAAGIAAHPGRDGGPAFCGGAVKLWSVGAYLEARGWTVLLSLDCPSIPWTCVIATQSPDHCFAIVDGHIHDGANAGLDGAEVAFVFVPPPGGGLPQISES